MLADESTGALDLRNAAVLLETLELLNAKLHATIMMVTHDAFAASYADRVLFIKDGKLFNEVRRGDDTRTRFYTRILEVQAFLGGEQGIHGSAAAGMVAGHKSATGAQGAGSVARAKSAAAEVARQAASGDADTSARRAE